MKKALVLAIGLVMLSAVNAFCVDIDAMMPVLKDAKDGIRANLVSLDNDLSAAAEQIAKLDFKSPQARQILSSLGKDRNYVIDCSIIDVSGKMVVVEPAEYAKYEGSDVSKQPEVIALQRDKKPMLSNIAHSVEGIDAVLFQYPMFSADKEFIGSLSVLIKQDALCANVVEPLVADIPCKIWIMQKNGQIVYDPDSNQIGRNIFLDEMYKSFPALVSFSRTVSLSESGAGSYKFYTKGFNDTTIVEKYTAWDTVSLYGIQWRVIVMEAQAAAPAKAEDKESPPKK